MNKEFERCCTFLAEMMEKYGLLVMQDILEELHYDSETWCYDAEGKIGIITNKHSIHGLYDNDDGFNVDCGCGDVWRIGYESECELLDELTAEEAIKIQAEMCSSMSSCVNCPIYKEKDGYRCESFKAENPEKVVEIIKQWKKDHEKKEIETEIVDLIKVMKQ